MKNVKLNILVLDVGGTHVKMKCTGQTEEKKFDSGPTLTPQIMVDGVKKLTEGWRYDVISIGCPTPVSKGKLVKEPINLGKGWVGFNFETAFQRPVKIINDASMQALGDYEGGRMLFLGLGTGLGSTLIEEGTLVPLELAHLPYKKSTFEKYVGNKAMEKFGKKKWRKEVIKVLEIFQAALEPEEIVLGGGNAKNLKEIPSACRLAANSNAFIGGFRLWEHPAGKSTAVAKPATTPTRKKK
ncbi:MAG: ROK family protein [Verrucomicrobia bacterium RIFCSPHIGHO2_12_FULL_41_10]|nr:MAG: ROK family protein [Verrucomicrobia bacterium RIFCSPHIGHO2_12_FULL_41_10]HLB33886.1 ROK family protein [Chthoniobacterales bacterium]